MDGTTRESDLSEEEIGAHGWRVTSDATAALKPPAHLYWTKSGDDGDRFSVCEERVPRAATETAADGDPRCPICTDIERTIGVPDAQGHVVHQPGFARAIILLRRIRRDQRAEHD